MTRELKLALIVGFSVLLVVTVLISDHLSKAQTSKLAVGVSETPAGAPAVRPQERLVAETPAHADSRLAVSEPTRSGDLPLPGVAPKPTEDRPLVIEQGGRTEPTVLSDAIKPSNDESIIVPNRAVAGGVPLVDTRSVGSGLEDVSKRTAGAVLPESSKAPTAPEAMTRHEPKPPAARPEATPAPTAERFHTVAAGENLSKLSRKYYGDPNQWKRIADANPKAVGKNGEVRVGARITIPEATPAAKPVVPQTRMEAPERTVAKSDAGTKPDPAAKAGVATKTPSRPEAPRNDVPRAALKAPQKELAKTDRPAVKEPVGRPEVAKAGSGSYTVRSGDTLSQIAQRELGSVTRMKDILELNKDVFDKDRPAVRVGQVIKLPKA